MLKRILMAFGGFIFNLNQKHDNLKEPYRFLVTAFMALSIVYTMQFAKMPYPFIAFMVFILLVVSRVKYLELKRKLKQKD